ncbi:MAG: RnfABCDGE type electron transport complex subunit G [Lachnospiraceae bacterium]|nr:RnfABCDGE type electron transport complex subunit G [Lachnospiraceae bacterium]
MNEQIKSMLRDALILLAITLVAGLALGFVYEVTKAPIANQELKAKNDACAEVFKDATSFESYEFDGDAARAVLDDAGLAEEDIDEVMTALDDGGNQIGYVLTVTSHEGYGGDITFSMGVKNDGTLNGISILSISETAGLGMKAKTDEFGEQWKDKKVDKFEYTKSGATADNQIDAISGATITTNAMTNGVNAGLAYFASIEGGSGNE